MVLYSLKPGISVHEILSEWSNIVLLAYYLFKIKKKRIILISTIVFLELSVSKSKFPFTNFLFWNYFRLTEELQGEYREFPSFNVNILYKHGLL